MKSRLVTACAVFALLFAACGGGNDDGGNGGDTASASRSPAASAGANAPEVDAAIPKDVKPAPDGGVNRTPEGEYRYTFASTQETAASSGSPRTSSPDAEWRSVVSYDEDVTVTQDSISTGNAVSTTRRQWEDDGVYELEFGLKTQQGTAGCKFSSPALVLPIPLKEGKLPKLEFEGDGTNCDGERSIELEQRADATDAQGHVWPTWRIRVETVTRTTTGVTSRQRDTRWFSPDLGKDIRIEGTGEQITADGVGARVTTEIVLRSYPKT